MNENGKAKPNEVEQCCYNCRHFLDREWNKPYQEISKLSNKPVLKQMKIGDGGCRRYPRPEPKNYNDICGEFSWKKR